MNEWIEGKIITVNRWTENLCSLILNASIDPFEAGQFTKLSLIDNTSKKKIQRAYSYVNAPSDKNLEIYIVRIPNGKLSDLLYNMNKNDIVFIKKKSYGFFTLSEVPNCKILWMFATGTAIGPYLSILQENKNTDKFDHIVLVHAVRYHKELIYLPLMKKIHKKYNGKLKIQTIVSRQEGKYSLIGRIPFLLKNNILENKVGLNIDSKNSHVMLCGNPEMVKDTYFYLRNTRNMKKHLRRMQGNITMENYW